MEEILTLSYNFAEPIGIIVHGEKVIGIVEEMEDGRVNLSGTWYQLNEVTSIAQ